MEAPRPRTFGGAVEGRVNLPWSKNKTFGDQFVEVDEMYIEIYPFVFRSCTASSDHLYSRCSRVRPATMGT